MDCYIGEIRMFGGNFAPKGWALCNGQILPIRGNEALYSLLGVNFGGNGQTTFGLPDLRGRVPVSQGKSDEGYEYFMGDKGGAENVTLRISEIPTHSHLFKVSGQNGTAPSPANNVPAAAPIVRFSDLKPTAAMDPRALLPQGGSQPHENMLPYLSINFIIALTNTGEFPSRNDG